MSTKTVSYTFSLLDRASSPMKTLTGASIQTIDKLSKLQTQSKALQAATKDLGGSLSTLRQQMDLMKAEKELINSKNINDIKHYNREIERLEKQIERLDNAGKKRGLSKYFGELKSTIGGVVNPLTLGLAGIGFAAKSGINLDEQFAKINVTAQLEGADFEKMKSDIIGIAKKNKVDLSMTPGAFEKIISQTGDVDLSMKILDSTLKGSKAGFTDVSVVADALAQSLSIVGKENASANEILDTFFAAKRVGAGEFKDFANYMPGLIASAGALNIKYKEVAGVFAYMTGKGQPAERASVLMNNMFSILGRKEVTDKLNKSGVAIFDNGKMRSTVDIFRDLSKLMSTMNDQQKSDFLGAVGVVDKEAKSSFMVMAADVDKLQSSLNDCANASGETDKALAFSANTAQRVTELWNSFKGKLIEAGTNALPLINVGLVVLGGALEIVSAIVSGVSTVFGGWYNALDDGNPIIWGLTVALGAAGVMLFGTKIKLMAVAAWNGIVATSTGVLSRALALANTTMLASPIGWIALGVVALTAGIVALCSKTDKATKSFAEFNVELAKNKAETKDGFAVAMQAAEGSDARKESIRKLNEQYGTYLPHLIDEKASNAELATALNEVNVQLERKLLNKFRDQAREEALKKANDAKTEILNWMLDQVGEGKQQQLAADFHNSWNKMSSGQSDWEKEEDFYKQKYDIGTGFWNNLMGGITWAGELYSNVGGELQNLQDAAYNYSQDSKRIDLLFAPPKIEVSVNGATQSWGTTQYPTAAGSAPLWNAPKSQYQYPFLPQSAAPASQQSAQQPIADSGRTVTQNNALINPLKGSGTGDGGAKSNVFDLDQQITNTKGSTAYNAVASKFNRVKIAGLAAASVVGMASTSPALTVPQISDGASTQLHAATSDNEDYNGKQKTLNLDKFCDQIVIHIANADDKGYEQIRQQVMQVLKEVTDEQV